MLKLIYGIDVKAEDDRGLIVVEEAVHAASVIANVGSYLGNSLRDFIYRIIF